MVPMSVAWEPREPWEPGFGQGAARGRYGTAPAAGAVGDFNVHLVSEPTGSPELTLLRLPKSEKDSKLKVRVVLVGRQV